MPDISNSPTLLLGAYSATELTILDGAVADAWEILSSQKHRPAWAFTREEVARHVVAAAAKGERDKATLTHRAIEEVTADDDR